MTTVARESQYVNDSHGWLGNPTDEKRTSGIPICLAAFIPGIATPSVGLIPILSEPRVKNQPIESSDKRSGTEKWGQKNEGTAVIFLS